MGLDKKAIEQSFIKNMEAGYAAAGNPDEFILPDAKIMGEALAKAVVDHLTGTAVVEVSGAIQAVHRTIRNGQANGAWTEDVANGWHQKQVTFSHPMPNTNYSVVITPASRLLSNTVALADFSWVDSLTKSGFKIKHSRHVVTIADINSTPFGHYYLAHDGLNYPDGAKIEGVFSGSGTIE